MKKLIGLVIVGLCLLVAVSQSDAYYETYKTNIKEGIDTMVKSPKPLVDTVKEEYNSSKFKPFGVFGGFFKGSFYALKEFSTGFVQVMTFNVDDENMFYDVFNKQDEGE